MSSRAVERFVTLAAISILVLLLLNLFGIVTTPDFPFTLLPISLFTLTWILLVSTDIIWKDTEVRAADMRTRFFWSLSFSFGLLHLIAFFIYFDLVSYIVGYALIAFGVIFVSYLSTGSIAQRALGYLGVSPFLIFGAVQIVEFAFSLFQRFFTFNDSIVILALVAALQIFLSWRLRRSRLNRVLFWTATSIGLLEITRIPNFLGNNLTYFIFPLVSLPSVLQANEWRRSARLRDEGYFLFALLPFYIAGVLFVGSELTPSGKLGLLSTVSLVVLLLFCIGSRLSMFLAISLSGLFGTFGFHLLILVATNYISWWLAYPLLVPVLAFMLYECFHSLLSGADIGRLRTDYGNTPVVSPRRRRRETVETSTSSAICPACGRNRIRPGQDICDECGRRLLRTR